MRLTKSMRREIEAAVLDDMKSEHDKVLVPEQRRLGDNVYQQFISPDDQKLLKKVPREFLSFSNHFRVKCNGNKFTKLTFPDAASRPIPLHWRYNEVDLTERSVPVKLEREVHKYIEHERSLKEQRMEAADKVRAVLNSVTTTDKLLKYWPSLEKYVPRNEQSAVSQQVAVRDEELAAAIHPK